MTLVSSLSDFLDHSVPLRPLIAKVSSRTVSHVSSSKQQQNVTHPPQTLPKPVTYIQPQSHSQPPPTYPKPPQTQPKPQGFIQPLPKPYLQTAPQPPPKPQVPPQTPPKPQSFPQTLVKSKSLPLDHSEDFSRHSAHSGDLLSPTESGEQLSDSMSAKQMSIRERWDATLPVLTVHYFYVYLVFFFYAATQAEENMWMISWLEVKKHPHKKSYHYDKVSADKLCLHAVLICTLKTAGWKHQNCI